MKYTIEGWYEAIFDTFEDAKAAYIKYAQMRVNDAEVALQRAKWYLSRCHDLKESDAVERVVVRSKGV